MTDNSRILYELWTDRTLRGIILELPSPALPFNFHEYLC